MGFEDRKITDTPFPALVMLNVYAAFNALLFKRIAKPLSDPRHFPHFCYALKSDNAQVPVVVKE